MNLNEPHPLTAPEGIPALEAQSFLGSSPASHKNGAGTSEILIITGQSGGGKTHAGDALEDLDWYVVDNLPPNLLLPLAGMMTPAGQGVDHLAAVVDVRGREFFKDLEGVLKQFQKYKVPYRLIFLEADDQTLVRRFTSSRRPHPLQGTGTILDGLAAEKELLEPLRERADEIIDTTDLSVHDLSRKMRALVEGESPQDVRVALISFGFKHGLPLDADQVLDVRFLKNPYWVDELRRLTGRDEPVSEYVLSQPGIKDFGTKYAELIEATLPGYRRELKSSVTVAIGCTGGRHRSVALTEYVAGQLRAKGVTVHITHRDIGRE